MLVQIALKRHPELKDVPLLQDLVKDNLHKYRYRPCDRHDA
jgi:hypothetical protein